MPAPPLMNFAIGPAQNAFEAMGVLNAIPIEANRMSAGESKKWGEKVVQKIRANLSDDSYPPSNKTGKLSRSIGYKVDEKTGELTVYAGDEEAYYAAWVEFGHGGPHPAPPHPYFFNTIQETFSTGEMGKEILQDILKRAMTFRATGYTMKSMGGVAPLTGLFALGSIAMTAFSGTMMMSGIGQ